MRRAALIAASVLLAAPGVAEAKERSWRYLVTISSKPTEVAQILDSGIQRSLNAQAEWTGRWFARIYRDRAKRTAHLYAQAPGAASPSSKHSSFVGTARGSYTVSGQSTSRACNWSTTARDAFAKANLWGEGADGAVSGASGSYEKSGHLALWLTYSQKSDVVIGTCSGSSSPIRSFVTQDPAIYFLDATQDVFGDRQDKSKVRIRVPARRIGAEEIVAEGTEFDAGIGSSAVSPIKDIDGRNDPQQVNLKAKYTVAIKRIHQRRRHR